MIWEALGAMAVGLAIAYAATRQLPERLPNRSLVLATGPAAALLGGLICHIVLGGGHSLVTLTVAALVSVAILSLLLVEGVRPTQRLGAEVPSPPHV
ncbi:hypothetical protein G4Z16_10245 [Streptomyces bathyalis]|uniref:Integral membrane protein n=1 Tax=Streptomyces bathyalis TaxID=2710756 RepID=A0A7T1T5H0_9ACTN|nr:hypothetical protein [Streptomyces bathyalis]QPP06710.1 hypothetical protein G4Z16_10245 [Streptomyces bathyalis]